MLALIYLLGFLSGVAASFLVWYILRHNKQAASKIDKYFKEILDY